MSKFSILDDFGTAAALYEQVLTHWLLSLSLGGEAETAACRANYLFLWKNGYQSVAVTTDDRGQKVLLYTVIYGKQEVMSRNLYVHYGRIATAEELAADEMVDHLQRHQEHVWSKTGRREDSILIAVIRNNGGEELFRLLRPGQEVILLGGRTPVAAANPLGGTPLSLECESFATWWLDPGEEDEEVPPERAAEAIKLLPYLAAGYTVLVRVRDRQHPLAEVVDEHFATRRDRRHTWEVLMQDLEAEDIALFVTVGPSGGVVFYSFLRFADGRDDALLLYYYCSDLMESGSLLEEAHSSYLRWYLNKAEPKLQGALYALVLPGSADAKLYRERLGLEPYEPPVMQTLPTARLLGDTASATTIVMDASQPVDYEVLYIALQHPRLVTAVRVKKQLRRLESLDRKLPTTGFQVIRYDGHPALAQLEADYLRCFGDHERDLWQSMLALWRERRLLIAVTTDDQARLVVYSIVYLLGGRSSGNHASLGYHAQLTGCTSAVAKRHFDAVRTHLCDKLGRKGLLSVLARPGTSDEQDYGQLGFEHTVDPIDFTPSLRLGGADTNQPHGWPNGVPINCTVMAMNIEPITVKHPKDDEGVADVVESLGELYQ